MNQMNPDYRKIYTDIILRKFPDKFDMYKSILQKKKLSTLDIINLNQMIFGADDRDTFQFNQRHKSYNEVTIRQILAYQKRNGYNNTQVASKFKLSRNSVARWKKIFNQ